MVASTSESNDFPQLQQDSPSYLSEVKPEEYAFILLERTRIRREFPLFVPDDGPNFFKLPRGIGPGSRFRIEAKGADIRIVQGPKAWPKPKRPKTYKQRKAR